MSIIRRIHQHTTDEERGAALVEYSLLLALIAIACILALTTLGTQAMDTITTLGEKIAAAGS